MKVTRRQFLGSSAAAFTVSFAAPAFLSDLVRAQGGQTRNFVILYLSGGNDALSMLVPYNDPFYYSRRPTISVPAGNALQVGADASNVALGLHPRLTGLKQIFDQGRLAFIQRTGYANQSRSHFEGTDIWSTANPTNPSGFGWLGRYLDTLPSPVDPLIGWNATSTLPQVIQASHVPVPAIASPSAYAFSSPNTGAEASAERTAATTINSHVPVSRPELAFVYTSAQAAMATLDRVASVASYSSSVTYPTSGLGQALKAVAGAMAKNIGTKVFYVTTGGYDNHSGQKVNETNGTYYGLMGTMNDALLAFYNDLKNQGLLQQTLLLTFSEFGRRITENGSSGTDHGAASVMLAMGGAVNGGLYGTAPNLNMDPANPTLENSAADVHFETDFRSVYARVLDNWLGADSVSILGGNFKSSSLTFV
ncbi:MAG TPA: DUF1501 domain-containing protein, partial [Vicinamibacterales bacterium]|jgi:uncharacterized protein (DUF1501 family)|nr:DUF1501 domain-containing protein [Vicinamibacterales bacterium]